MNRKELTWEEVKKNLNITSEQEEEIKLEMEIMEATIEARKKAKLSQRDLSKKTGIKQPAIARIEKGLCSPKVSTLLKLLHPIGYTLKIVPIKRDNKQSN